MDSVIVSRHQATIAYIAGQLYDDYDVLDSHVEGIGNTQSVIPVIRGNATPDDVRGKVVFGNIPMHLACHAHTVYAVEFDGAPPRGQEYSVDDMIAAGVRLTPYVIERVECPICGSSLSGGNCPTCDRPM